MKDEFNRIIDYARISVTDKCNYRCTYCMPELDNNKADLMSDEQILDIISALAKNGVKYIKITGGEPLVRVGIFDLIKNIKKIDGIKQVTITTNGALLDKYFENLQLLDGINVSIDAIDQELFKNITGFYGSEKIINNIIKMSANGIENIKINCVLIKGMNENEYVKIANLTKNLDICVKFIEMMPIGHGKDFEHFSLEDLKEKLSKEMGKLTLLDEKYGNGPAEYYKIDGFKGKIGLIGAVSHKFCENCNRIRITSDGFLKTCLQYESGTDLKQYLNSDKMADIIKKAVYNKQECHEFDQKSIINNENRLMSQIGG